MPFDRLNYSSNNHYLLEGPRIEEGSAAQPELLTFQH
jgi:hypothetical protein